MLIENDNEIITECLREVCFFNEELESLNQVIIKDVKFNGEITETALALQQLAFEKYMKISCSYSAPLSTTEFYKLNYKHLPFYSNI